MEKHSSEIIIFDLAVRGCGDLVSNHFSEIIPYFKVLLLPENDPDVVIVTLALLDTVVRTKLSNDVFAAYGQMIVGQLLLPNCTWRVRRVASTIRKIGVSCLEQVMANNFVSKDCVGDSFLIFVTTTVSCLSDDESVTRRITCNILRSLFSLYTMVLTKELLETYILSY